MTAVSSPKIKTAEPGGGGTDTRRIAMTIPFHRCLSTLMLMIPLLQTIPTTKEYRRSQTKRGGLLQYYRSTADASDTVGTSTGFVSD